MKIFKSLSLFFLFILPFQSIFADGAENFDLLQCKFEKETDATERAEFNNDNLNVDMKCRHRHHRRHSCCSNRCICESSPLGIAGFTVNDPALWYTILTPSFPEAVLLSQNRNNGSTQGDITLNASGLTINEAGNYSISFQAILQNPEERASSAFIPVFVALNGSLDPTTAVVASVVTLPSNSIGVAQGTGILENVLPGTQVTIIATNGGSPDLEPITVISWNISLFKIADECCK